MNLVTFVPSDPLPAEHYNGVQTELFGILQILNALFNFTGGYVGPAANNGVVSEATSPSATAVKVAGPALYWIDLDTMEGGAPFYIPAASTAVTVPALNTTGGQSRNDLIVARVNVGAVNTYSFEAVQGTPATTGAQTDPAEPDNSIKLARITRAHGDAAINNAEITDLRVAAKIPTLHQA